MGVNLNDPDDLDPGAMPITRKEMLVGISVVLFVYSVTLIVATLLGLDILNHLLGPEGQQIPYGWVFGVIVVVLWLLVSRGVLRVSRMFFVVLKQKED